MDVTRNRIPLLGRKMTVFENGYLFTKVMDIYFINITFRIKMNQSNLTYRKWMSQSIYLSKRNIKAVPEQSWDWYLLGRMVSWDIIYSLSEKPWDWDNLSSRKGLDLEFVKKHADFNWNWTALSEHPDLTMEMITSLPQKSWDYRLISGSNNNLSLDDILAHSEMDWNWMSLTQRVTSVEIMKRFPDKNWDWEWFSEHGKFNIQEVVENPELPWNWNKLSRHPDLTWDIVRTFIKKDWSWVTLSARPFITLDIVMKYPKMWSWSQLSKNPSITADMVRKHPMMPWDFKAMSYNRKLVSDDGGQIILDFKECEWDWYEISSYAHYDFIYTFGLELPFVLEGILEQYTPILWSFVEQTADIFPWPWIKIIEHERFDTEAAMMLLPHMIHDFHAIDVMFRICLNKVNLIEVAIELFNQGFEDQEWFEDLYMCKFWTPDYLVKYPDMPWDWDALSENKKTTMEFIEKNMQLPWDWSMVSENDNLTWQFIMRHPNQNWDHWAHSYRREMWKKGEYDIQKARIQSRSTLLKEEIVAGALHPTRFLKYLETYNYDMSEEKYI